jgi:hypothetical protein
MKIIVMLAAIYALTLGCTYHGKANSSSSADDSPTGAAKMATEAGTLGSLSKADFDAVSEIAMELIMTLNYKLVTDLVIG